MDPPPRPFLSLPEQEQQLEQDLQPEQDASTVPALPQALVDELRASVKGDVLFPTDPQFPERAKTFNGRLKPRCRLLVSPLDARDVSAVVAFCVRHGLSPSVRAGGYGIAGWCVAGDVVVDMSKIKDIEVEPPLQNAEEGTQDWTPMRDMPPPGSKGKARAQGIRVVATPAAPPPPPPPAERPDLRTTPSTGKRRREPSAEPEDITSIMGTGNYANASHAVSSFLRGPAMPPIPGEAPRQPPTHEPPSQRPRLHSPEPESSVETETDRPQSTRASAHDREVAVPPAMDDATRQISSGSTDSSASGSGFSAQSASTSATSALTSPTLDSDGTPQSQPNADPFSYLSGAAISGPASGAGVGVGVSALPTFLPPPLNINARAVGSSSGVTAWNPAMGMGFSASGVLGSSPFSMPPMPPTATSSESGAMPPGLPFSSPGLGASAAFAQALQAAQAASGHLGTMPHARPVHPHAYVTFGAGLSQKEVDIYTADNPLDGVDPVSGESRGAAVPYHIPMSAHPAGSAIMLLAGFGFISRMHGLSIDNLVEVEMVLADGQIVTVNADEDPELWWAVRGAGPAFGIATRYKARAFPVPVVFAGNLIYRFHRATAASLIKHFRDCIKGAPRELYANVLLTAGPANKDSLVVIQMCYVGPKEKGLEFLQAISSWDGERCLLNEVNEKSFLNQQDSVAQVLRGKAGRQWFLRSSLVTSLPDELITKTVIEFADTPIGCTWIFELAGGAICDFDDTCLPKEQREAAWTVAALHQWDMGVDDPRCVSTAEDWMKHTIRPHSVGGPFPTFLGRHEPASRAMACYGKNWARLAALKRKYDPDGLFKNNFWPLDKDGEPVGELYNEPPSP
ncbi:hypothetical protein L226DRAFT_472397 [Lentinus tigrinus ALCF2SS1-7]|uniref:Berberine/berberine-like domain-containing protein n=1 Tax=Lentinus tigrinus ALCF2SS1-6 TaxID=1328759 RepID=A0A5C2S2N9_9APHY|nr:hypothetical protein L227DRAFT_613237 [Lentinus tigrinus ALCF2SS1-6]RPD69032.1 hypothetical protein L226DRAFT_472397 [Lentinus tigrinus ALCF2SS1-7]